MTRQIAIVTGAAAGFGRAIASRLASDGTDIVIFDVDAAGAQATAEEVRAQGVTAEVVIGSVADPDDVRRAFAFVDDRFGGVDILINNAGVTGNRPTVDVTDDEWRRTMSIDLDGVFYCSREAGRAMIGRRPGVIVNIGSIYSLVAAPERASYCASKAGVAMLTRSLAVEWAPHGIRVNCVAPGYADTAMMRELAAVGKIALEPLLRRTPQGRLTQMEDVAETVAFLCDPRSAHITGQVIAVDGGWTANGYI
ncbi:SDR family NAD(P)-dependent oxidoreductase [Sphingobium chlorophenolicum]|uniref:3-oxoacyl-(Acyl-carrier-protein) reductase n=1 Tax=Sphingobium chlorophenolicum TaxID=46429 RepID=A0A081RAS8_SPHCR|nr:SDR family NAD(P)-dependent oxidoreductase [Sphingobium chlorophenolicum]KEQ52301.1 3-oxoacyl-(Acyl-carrier-protein) reductase precursor [Sphingobium chlorophenolicum]